MVIVMPLPVAADSEAVDFDYLIGTGPLCGVPVPAPCPDVAEASNGYTLALTGSGTLTTHPKTVTGGGTLPTTWPEEAR
ncbi:MAG: hypothetical protein LC739_05640 [Actinobacteria bacterium]|nr:hypothetical protein [Actinomycetota bacterium]